MRYRLFFIQALVLILFSSCVTFNINRPEGFALVEEGDRFVAVSPEGLTFRVKTEANYPEKDVEFWSKALMRHLEEGGYHPRSEGDFFDCPAGRGFFIEWTVPYRGEAYTYLTGIVPSGEVIYLAEAAGEHELYRTYRSAIIESIKSISSE